jgi:uncharacterized protein YrrD
MHFKQGTHVYTNDRQDAGTVDRVVLDSVNDEVKALVVRKGWLFSEDKVVPISLVDSANEDEVILHANKDELQKLPEYEDTYYVPADEYEAREGAPPAPYAPSLYLYPPVGAAWWGYDPYIGANPVYAYAEDSVARVEKNIPEGTVAVREGAQVTSLEGEHVGEVVDIFSDEATNRVTHLVISHGTLFKNRKLIPSNWIKIAGEEEVILNVRSSVVNGLSDYQAETHA